MREIKFRGKRVDNSEWVFGDYGQFHKHDGDWTHEIHCPIPKISGSFWNEVTPETIGQFTGLKDKNGVKIFEGDVVRYLNSIESGNGVVIFDTCAFLFNWIDIYETDSILRYFQCSKELEVIGNIHDNQELLRGVEND